MTKETVLLRQNFRSKLNFLQDFFKSTLVNDVQSGDNINQLSLEKCIPHTYPLIIDLSHDLLTDNRTSFETHVLSFLFYHSISKSSNMRVYYGIGHPCDYDKTNNSLGLSTPNNINFYAVVVENEKVHSITARQLGKNKTQFEKNIPTLVCSYSFLPPSPLLLDDSGYLDSLYNTVSKDAKKYCQAFNSALEAVNTTILEEIITPMDSNSLHIYFLNVLLEHELAKQHQDIIKKMIDEYSETPNKTTPNALTFTPNQGSRRIPPTTNNAKDFFASTLNTLKDRANSREEREALEQLKNYFSRHLGFDSGPLKLEQIIKKPILKTPKPTINEYDVKDVLTRTFSPNRIQPLNTLLTDQKYQIAHSYQGAKENFQISEWSSSAYPMLIVEPTSNLTTNNILHLHFIAFTLKESYTKTINANTMYRYLGYGYPFYFDGSEFKLNEENLNLYAFIFKKGVFTSFSTLHYLSFYDQQPTNISLNGKRPTTALDIKFRSSHDTLEIAVKNNKKIKEESIERLNEINASYNRYLKKNKKQPNPKTALEYIANMMQRTAKMKLNSPAFAVNTEIILNHKDFIEPISETTIEKINSNTVQEQDSILQTEPQLENTNEHSVESDTLDRHHSVDTDKTESLVIESNTEKLDEKTDLISNKSDHQSIDSTKIIYVNQPMNSLDLPPIIEQKLHQQGEFKVDFIHTPNIYQEPLSKHDVNVIVEMTRDEPKQISENHSYNINHSEIVLDQSSDHFNSEDNLESLTQAISLFSNLSIKTIEWSSLKSDKYEYSGLSISINKKHLFIREQKTDNALKFNIKQILEKTDDYYLLKRAVGKVLAKKLRKFIKLKADQNFLLKFIKI